MRVSHSFKFILAGLTVSFCFFLSAFASDGPQAALVRADSLRLRVKPDLQSEVIGTAQSGDPVLLLAPAEQGFYPVSLGNQRGYMSAEYLEPTSFLDAQLGVGRVQTGGVVLNVRNGPDVGQVRLFSLSNGSEVDLIGFQDGWFRIRSAQGTGFVSGAYIVSAADPTAGAVSPRAAQVVATAKSFLGTPYCYGGNGPKSFDCSGFSKYIYAQFGCTLNRTATAQLQNGTAVSRSELAPGDLVFFRYKTTKPVSHVGIYIGNGQFIHASTRTYKVMTDSLLSGHYSDVYVYARRILQ